VAAKHDRQEFNQPQSTQAQWPTHYH